MRLGWLLFATLLAQAQPAATLDAAAILKRVSETYAHPKQYDFAAKAEPRASSGKGPFSFRIAVKSPDRVRTELRGSMAAELLGFESDLLTVVDGQFTWTYTSKPSQYSRETGGPMGESPRAYVSTVERLFFQRYRAFTEFAERAAILQNEAIEAGGGPDGSKVECFVILIKPESPRFPGEFTWWVDKKRFLVLREDSDEGRIVYDVAKFDEPIADEVFTFKPLAGAKQVEKILQ